MVRIREIAIYEFIHTLLNAIDSQVKSCLKYGVKCRDPPAITSSMLRHKFKFSEFKIKRFWRVAKFYHGYSLNVYRVKNAWFHLVILVKRGIALNYYNTDFFPDPFDCSRLKCVEYPNENVLYLYLEGGLGGEALRINVIYILRKLLEVRPKCYEMLLKGVSGIIDRDLTKIMESIPCLFRMLRDYSTILSDLLPFIPKNIKDLLLISPILGSIMLRLNIR